jgi:hypothetical protein
MPALTGFVLTKFPSDILYDAGIVYHGATPFGVTEGPPKFDPGETFDQITFDGQHAPIKGLYRQLHGAPTMAFTMKEFGQSTTGAQVGKVEPGSTTATVSTTETITPAKSGILVASGSYVPDFRVIWERGAAGSGLYFAVHFAVALYRKYGIQGQNKKEAQIPVEVVGCLDMATASINDPAYNLEYRTALP